MKPSISRTWRRGKRLMLYRLGGAEVHDEQWREPVFFYKFQRQGSDGWLYYRQQPTSKVLRIRSSALDRIEESWGSLPEDVRHKPQEEVERQGRRADRINADAPVVLRRPRVDDGEINDIIDLLLPGDIARVDIEVLTDRGHTTVETVKAALDWVTHGKERRPSTPRALFERSVAIARAREDVPVPDLPEIPDEPPPAIKTPEPEPMTHMPASMVRELDRLKERSRSLERRRHTLETELQDLVAELDSATQRVTDIEKAWATVQEVMAND